MSITYLAGRAVIDAPGDYTIDRDLTLSDPNAACVLINAGVHYVTIRLRSRLVYGGPSSGLSRGIECNGSAAVNIIGDGGSISGFYFGIRMSSCYLAKIRDVAIINGLFRGITVDGDEGMVRGCDVRNIAGTTYAPTARTCGIEISGARPKLLGNYVENVVGMSEEAIGLSVTDRGIDGIVAFNVMKCAQAAAPLANGDPGSYGLWVGGESKVSDDLNLIEGWAVGAAFSSPTSGDIGGNRYTGCLQDRIISSPNVILSVTDA